MVTIRKDFLVNNEIYHIFNRSIAGYVIFNNFEEYSRMIQLIKLCRYKNFDYKYSQFFKLDLPTRTKIINKLNNENDILVEIVAFCLMPTHIHLLLKQIMINGITKYLGRISNSYSKYFNIKHARIGPLWSGRFKNVIVENDVQLLHLTRYIHLNPTSAMLVKNPKDWVYSSYLEYINPNDKNKICIFDNLFDLSAKKYEKFCLDRKSYQRELSKIKSISIDN